MTNQRGEGLLLFAAVGLRAARTEDAAGVLCGNRPILAEGLDEAMISKAEQRQMVWQAVHQALSDQDGELPAVVVEVFMLQDVWLYDRLFRWLTANGGRCSRECLTRQISQEELDLLVHEFGEETATHFLFVEHYTRHLRVAAVVLLLCMAFPWLSRLCSLWDVHSVEDCKRAVLSFFLPAWGFHFLASWRRESSKAGFRWQGSLGSVQNSMKEIARLQAVESKEAKYLRFLRVALLSVPLMFLQLAVVLAVSTSFVCMEVYIYDMRWGIMTQYTRALAFLLYNFAFGVAFIIILALFHPVSKAVTMLECHPLPDLAQWHLTTKIFGNWFLAVFLYFFVIAFCYIPFGTSIADTIAALLDGGDAQASAEASAKGNFSITMALQKLEKPDINRLAVDVCLFFLLQDFCRLLQILFPVVRAAWGLGQLRGAQKGKQNRNKRTAIFFKACGMCRVCCNQGPCRRRRSSSKVTAAEMNHEGSAAVLLEVPPRTPTKAELPTSSFAKALWKRSATMSLVPSRMPRLPTTPAPATRQGEVFVVYCLIGHMQIQRSRDDVAARDEVAMAACSLAPGGALAVCEEEDEDSPHVLSRLRVCCPVEHQQGLLAEDADEDLGDLITLTCNQRTLAGGGAKAAEPEAVSVRLNIVAEVLEQGADAGASPLMRGESISSRSWRFNDDALQGGNAVIGLDLPERGQSSERVMSRVGTLQLGPVRLEYAAGIVRGPTHPEALEKVPRALRLLRQGSPTEHPGSEPSPLVAAHEEARALDDEPQRHGALPWVWWDEDLAGLYWDEIFELYAVKETFETFEIYAHLTTQFSYVCLFGIAAPVMPPLALLFTSMEVRQDQLRLLWLSRPPHPDRKTLKFNARVSVGAWYEIIKFTCHMSVAVNLLLWGLTYAGCGSEPAKWTAAERWRALAVFLICQQACFFLSGMLHRTVSQLDQQTASAYLRRYNRLKQCLLESTVPVSSRASCRQGSHEAVRRQLTRATSQGLTCLI
uniref:Anoctamin transmembrane domain-containing protein n=1 Tax=Pyrodinium bahamense TaxID=73915 RepID=A0A7S0ABC3_9DINO